MGRRFRPATRSSNADNAARPRTARTSANACLRSCSGVSPAATQVLREIGYRDWAHEDGVFHLFEHPDYITREEADEGT